MRLRTSTCLLWLTLCACGSGEDPPAARTRLTELSAGRAHTCGLDESSVLWCWGLGTSGQLGGGDRASRDTPTRVPSSHSWSGIATGGAHTCALDDSGAVWCWGAGAAGQLGRGRALAQSSPARAMLDGAASRLSAGRSGTCAATRAGVVWCWGDGVTRPRVRPDADATNGLASGDGGACALSARDTLTCWGALSPNDDTSELETPTRWRSLEARGPRACGLDIDGAMWCVGRSAPGFGTGSGDTETPWEVHPGPLQDLTLGHDAWCARGEGGIVCAGSSGSGQLGSGLAVALEPKRLGSSDWQDVALGVRHGCGVVDGEPTCWGSTRDGRSGDGRRALALTPEQVPLAEETVALVSVDLQTCALSKTGTIRCWGASTIGSSLDGSTRVETSPRVLEAPDAMTELGLGSGHIAALDASGEAYHAEPSSPGLARLGVPEPLTSLASSPLGACALSASGRPSCWGPTGRAITPTPLPQGVDPAFDLLALGPDYQCGVASETRALWCWGSNLRGQLGVGDRTPRTQPSIAWTDRVRDVSASLTHACAVAESGDMRCWGDNARGQLPLSVRETTIPTQVNGGRWSRVSVGFSHGCALDDEGAAHCWGDNTSGALGDGTTTRRRAPTRVETSLRFDRITAGATHTCALDVDAKVWCWGAGDLGQLGLTRYAGQEAP